MAESWGRYVGRFHRERPGITERVLIRSLDGGQNPYEWLAAAVDDGAPVLDVACGSAPMLPLIGAGRYIGVDASEEELALAATRGGGELVAGRADALPFEDGSMSAVVCSMALQVLHPLPEALAEAARVLRPGGRLAATVLGGRVAARDLPVVAGLLVSLGRGLDNPNDALLRRPRERFAAAGLRLIEDRPRRFAFPLAAPEDAALLLDSLYLPGIRERREHLARSWLGVAARLRAPMPVPIRRLIAVKSG